MLILKYLGFTLPPIEHAPCYTTKTAAKTLWSIILTGPGELGLDPHCQNTLQNLHTAWDRCNPGYPNSAMKPWCEAELYCSKCCITTSGEYITLL